MRYRAFKIIKSSYTLSIDITRIIDLAKSI